MRRDWIDADAAVSVETEPVGASQSSSEPLDDDQPHLLVAASTARLRHHGSGGAQVRLRQHRGAACRVANLGWVAASRGAARAQSDGPFNHDTGKGWVKGKQGEYHDALFNKNNRDDGA